MVHSGPRIGVLASGGGTILEAILAADLPVVVMVSLAFAGWVSAHNPPPLDPADFSFVATIDCGDGPVEVGSTDDIYAPLIDLQTLRKYEPVAWDVSFGDFHFVDTHAVGGIAEERHLIEPGVGSERAFRLNSHRARRRTDGGPAS